LSVVFCWCCGGVAVLDSLLDHPSNLEQLPRAQVLPQIITPTTYYRGTRTNPQNRRTHE